MVLVPLHGLGGSQDLPLPFPLVVAGAVSALVASFVVLAVAIHAPIGVRNILREWTPWRSRAVDLAVAAFGALLLLLGLRAALAVFF